MRLPFSFDPITPLRFDDELVENLMNTIESEYHPWTATEERLQTENFCVFPTLISLLFFMKTLPFGNYHLRKRILSLLDLIKITNVVTKRNRFPDDIIVANLNNGFCADLMKSIVRALCCRTKTSCTDEEMDRQCNCRKIYIQRINCILELTQMVPFNDLYVYGIFNKDMFEMWYGLSWS
ncbi:hypothetical protein M0802_010094 [Mischocyttarus mexicanus]|nr:hypothetical protein M0802_010094 [Mischocyttarus mexicanus]